MRRLPRWPVECTVRVAGLFARGHVFGGPARRLQRKAARVSTVRWRCATSLHSLPVLHAIATLRMHTGVRRWAVAAALVHRMHMTRPHCVSWPGLRRRSGSAAAPSGGAKQTGLLRSYTDDPGLKLTPVRVFAPVSRPGVGGEPCLGLV